MAFLDKLSEVAKDVGEKAGDAVEITKLSAKIAKEEKAINDATQKLGAIYLAKLMAGEPGDADATALCEEVKAHQASIEELKAQKAAVKAD